MQPGNSEDPGENYSATRHPSQDGQVLLFILENFPSELVKDHSQNQPNHPGHGQKNAAISKPA